VRREPSFDDFDNVPLFGFVEFLSFRDVVPFGETAATAGGGGVLGDENRMIAPGRLLAVIGGFGWREPLFDKICGVLEDGFQTFLIEIIRFLFAQIDSAPKLGILQIVQNFLHVSHKRILEFAGKF
jgi:hypothetical protein